MKDSYTCKYISFSHFFTTQGIPTLIMMDENWKVITTNGRGAIASDPEGKVSLIDG